MSEEPNDEPRCDHRRDDPPPPDPSPPGPVSDRLLRDLRLAATLVHGVPGLRARVTLDGAPLVDVGGPDTPTVPTHRAPAAPGRPLVVSGCWFRCAVAAAHRDTAAGHPVSLLHLPASAAPAVEIDPPVGGASPGGGIYRVPVGDGCLWSFATTLEASVAFDLGLALADTVAGVGVSQMGVRSDTATGVAFAYLRTTAAPGSSGEAQIIEWCRGVLARWAVAELLDEVGAGA